MFYVGNQIRLCYIKSFPYFRVQYKQYRIGVRRLGLKLQFVPLNDLGKLLSLFGPQSPQL